MNYTIINGVLLKCRQFNLYYNNNAFYNKITITNRGIHGGAPLWTAE